MSETTTAETTTTTTEATPQPTTRQSITDLYAGKAAPAEATPAPTKTEAKPAPTRRADSILDAISPKTTEQPAAKPAVTEDADEAAALKDTKSESGRANIKRLAEAKRAIESEYKTKRAELETELQRIRTEHESLLGKTKDFDRISTEHKTANERLRILDFQNHPEFIEKYVNPSRETMASMQQALQAAGKTADVGALLSLPLAERRKAANQIISEMQDRPIEVTEFRDNLFRYEKLERDRAEALKNSEQLRGRFDAEQAAKRQHAVQIDEAVLDGVFRESIESRYREAVVADDASDEEKAWAKKFNDGFRAMKQSARDLAFKAPSSPEEAARMAVGYADAHFRAETVLPAVVARYESVQKQLDEARAELAAIESKRARYNGAGTDDSGNAAPISTKDAIRGLYKS